MNKKLLPITVFLICIGALWLATCTEDKRDNVYDPLAENYLGDSQLDSIRTFAPNCKKPGNQCLEDARKNAKKLSGLFTLEITTPKLENKKTKIGSPDIRFQGTITPKYNLEYFLINNQSVSVTVQEGKINWKTVINLRTTDTYVIRAMDIEGNLFEDTVTIIYDKSIPDKEGPIIQVDNLKAQDTVLTEIFFVTGTILDRSEIDSFTIKDQTVVRKSENRWSKSLQLKEGLNGIILFARDVKNNQTSDAIFFHCKCSSTASLDPSSDTDFVEPVIEVLHPEQNTELSRGEGMLDHLSAIIQLKTTDLSQVDKVVLSKKKDGGGTALELKDTLFNLDNDTVAICYGDDTTSCFSDTITLDLIDNTFYATAWDKSVNLNKSVSKLHFTKKDMKPPQITFVEPNGNTTVASPEITIKIKAFDIEGGDISKSENAVTIQVNDDDTQFMEWISDSQNWQKQVQLQPGENTVNVVAEDKTGNTSPGQIKITYQP